MFIKSQCTAFFAAAEGEVRRFSDLRDGEVALENTAIRGQEVGGDDAVDDEYQSRRHVRLGEEQGDGDGVGGYQRSGTGS